MRVTINDTAYEVPFDPALITLGEFVEYKEQYGNDLDKRSVEIFETKYSEDVEDNEMKRTIELQDHLITEALSWFSFWTKIDLLSQKKELAMTDLINRYRVLSILLREETEKTQEFPMDIEWENETWHIQNFKVDPDSEMTNGEAITTMEVIRQIFKIGKTHWDALIYLCAVFFRKKGELYSEKLISEKGERLKLLRKLPLTHALSVAFFLLNSMLIYLQAFLYSTGKEQETPSLS